MAKTKLLSLMEVEKTMENFLGKEEMKSLPKIKGAERISSLVFQLQKTNHMEEVLHLLLDTTEEEISFIISFQESQKLLSQSQEELLYSSIDSMNENPVDIVEEDFENHNIIILSEEKKKQMLKQARVYQALGLQKESAIACSLYDNTILFS